MTDTAIVRTTESTTESSERIGSVHSLWLWSRQQAQGLLLRMFADPRALAKEERADLVKQLRDCVARHPDVSDLRVVYGMALCVNLDAQEAMEELGEAVSLDPNSYHRPPEDGRAVDALARLHQSRRTTRARRRCWRKIWRKSEMARRQAATLRTMMREGVERGGYRTPWLSLGRLRRLWNRNRGEAEALATVDAG